MINIYNLSLVDLLPSVLKNDKKIIALAHSLDVQMQDVTRLIIDTVLLPRINELPEELINLLAWQLHVDFYEPLGLELEKKRELVKNSIFWHRRKGTKSVVEDILRLLFLSEFSVDEWFDYGGKPYFFRITTTDSLQNQQFFEEMIRAIYSVKNTRSWLEMIRVIRDFKQELYFATGSIQKTKVKIKHLLPVLQMDFDLPNVFIANNNITINKTITKQSLPNNLTTIILLYTKNVTIIKSSATTKLAYSPIINVNTKISIKSTAFYAKKIIVKEVL